MHVHVKGSINRVRQCMQEVVAEREEEEQVRRGSHWEHAADKGRTTRGASVLPLPEPIFLRACIRAREWVRVRMNAIHARSGTPHTVTAAVQREKGKV